MDLHGYLRAVRKGWWIVVLCVVLGALAAAVIVIRATPIYAAKLTFYVGATTTGTTATSPEATDLFLQNRAVSYANLASSDRLADMVVATADLKMNSSAVASRISGAAKLNTVLFVVTVQDSNPARALAIASAVGKDFPTMVADLDKNASAGTSPGLHVVSGPAVGASPISPRKALDLAAGIAAGLIAGLLLAVVRELLDTAVRTPEQLSELTGRPILGQVTFDSAARSSPLFLDEQHGVRRSEEFRHLRTNLSFLDVAEPVRVLVVTSSLEVEGKSTTAANLAVVAAETEARVLLIEADLRRPSVSSYLGLEHSSGLTNVLVGQVDVDDVLQRWGGDRLSVLSSGPVPPNPSELLGSSRMAALLARLREQFDMIIIDTPPLLPVTDAAVISRYADGVLLVVRHGKTKRNQVQQSMRDLDTVDARLLGSVLNMRPTRGVDSSSYYGGSYYTAPAVDNAGGVLIEDEERSADGRAAGEQALPAESGAGLDQPSSDTATEAKGSGDAGTEDESGADRGTRNPERSSNGGAPNEAPAAARLGGAGRKRR